MNWKNHAAAISFLANASQVFGQATPLPPLIPDERDLNAELMACAREAVEDVTPAGASKVEESPGSSTYFGVAGDPLAPLGKDQINGARSVVSQDPDGITIFISIPSEKPGYYFGTNDRWLEYKLDLGLNGLVSLNLMPGGRSTSVSDEEIDALANFVRNCMNPVDFPSTVSVASPTLSEIVAESVARTIKALMPTDGTFKVTSQIHENDPTETLSGTVPVYSQEVLPKGVQNPPIAHDGIAANIKPGRDLGRRGTALEIVTITAWKFPDSVSGDFAVQNQNGTIKLNQISQSPLDNSLIGDVLNAAKQIELNINAAMFQLAATPPERNSQLAVLPNRLGEKFPGVRAYFPKRSLG